MSVLNSLKQPIISFSNILKEYGQPAKGGGNGHKKGDIIVLSNNKATCQCDSCGKLFFSTFKTIKKNVVNDEVKTYCTKCSGTIGKELKYGNSSYNNRTKAIKTNLANYGMKGTPRQGINKGRKSSDKTKELQSEKAKIRLQNKEDHPMYGKQHSQESNEKNRQSQFKNIENGFRYGSPSNYESGEFYSKKLDKVIKYRSSYERTFLYILENSNIEYRYEELSVPYIFEEKEHRYIPDFELIYKDKHFIIEIKPKRLQTNPKVLAKKEATEKYCQDHNMIYRFLDHDEFMQFILVDLNIQIEDINKSFLEELLKFSNEIAKI